MSKYKHSLFVFALFFLFLIIGQSVLALEVDYPPFPPYAISSNTTLPQYIQYVFWSIITLAGTIGIISIVISGLRILMSFGKPEAISVARQNLLSSVLGITLLATSIIILTAINPELINPTTAVNPLQPDIYLRGFVGVDADHPTGYEYSQAPPQVPDTTKLKSFEKELYYYCGPGGTGKNLLVWTYNKEEYEKDGGERTVSMSCGGPPLDITTPLSFARNYEEAGVYFYKTNNCDGGAFSSNFSSPVHKDVGGSDIRFYYVEDPVDFVKSVRIVNGSSKDERYGVILNKEGGNGGECTEPIIRVNSGEECFEIPKDLSGNDFKPQSVYVIKYNPDNLNDGYVDLNSKNLFARFKPQNSVEPQYDIVSPTSPFYIYKPRTGSLSDDTDRPEVLIREQFINDNMIYTDGSPEDECCVQEDPALDCDDADPAFESSGAQTCLQGVDITGSFYVVLYAGSDQKGAVCQVLTKDNLDIYGSNLFNYERRLYKIAIIPQR